MQKNIKIILSKALSFGVSDHKYALWWRKCRPFYAVWMSSRRYSHANYYRQFMAEQLSDNVRNGGGLFPHSSILLLKLLLTNFFTSAAFICNLPSLGRGSCSLEIVVGDDVMALTSDCFWWPWAAPAAQVVGHAWTHPWARSPISAQPRAPNSSPGALRVQRFCAKAWCVLLPCKW